jgi:quinol-cytochrome oxidoreductase complex cytochrome b subunit
VASPSLRRWLEHRLGAASLLARWRARQVPGRNPSLYLGGLLLFLFVLEIASGILLLLPYRPDTAEAHASVANIVGRIAYGSLVRGVHYWAGQLFVAVLIALVVALLLTAGYRAPREFVWWSALILLALGVGMAFTGAILPWSESSYLQALVSSQMAGDTPLLGHWLERFLRGGHEVNAWTLHHAYGFHTGVLPATVTLVVAFGLFTIARTPRDSEASEHAVPLLPDFLTRLAALCVGVLAVVITLAAFAAPALGAAADPRLAAPLGAKPPWYFLFLHALLKASPPRLLGLASAKFIVGALGLFALALVALPLVDRRGSRFAFWATVTLVAVAVVLTFNAMG